MKKFEMPKLNISLFDVENVVTVSNTATQNAQDAITTAAGADVNTTTTTAGEWTLTF